ncbi:glycosyltransferase [Fulvimarina sp. MAC3]|uniref:glycosyltransferase n=1 Tax=Fulvimarina sp. MAC3 TaxID=3148887 RepID=UPI0031FD02F7
MRIVIDLQGAQSTGSRKRGIGRYSMALTKAILANRGDHDVIVALSDLFPDTVEPIVEELENLLPRQNIRVWVSSSPVTHLDKANNWRREVAELTRETFLASLKPDVVLLSSLFEGLGDDAVASIGKIDGGPPTAVILYDLIPFIHRSPYLDNPVVETWYLEKIDHLRKAALCLAISESARLEAIEYLDMPADHCVTISTDADPQFGRIEIAERREEELRNTYGLNRPFVMYTGGIDYRKNLDALIESYASLPESVRKQHHLAIVCSAQAEQKQRLIDLARRAGLAEGELVVTGFVPEDDLIMLYNICTLFIFPSWHEGFGLPALEAMRCGASVIGSNVSSIPEVIGWDEALFDPHSRKAMTSALERGLTDEQFRQRLAEHGVRQANKFSWDNSALTAIAAMERLHEKNQVARKLPDRSTKAKPKLAFVSPLPPERSGIADYSAELLHVLSHYYQIDVIVDQEAVSDDWINQNCAVRNSDWLIAHRDNYDRVLYHFGNSSFHQYMFRLIAKIPGVVVLHDFFLSGISHYMEIHGFAPGYWTNQLYDSHGYSAFRDRFLETRANEVVWTYPTNLDVLRESLGIITHSFAAAKMAREWYGEVDEKWSVVGLLRDATTTADRSAARKKFSFEDDHVVVSTFGMVNPTKQSIRLLQAWKKSRLSSDPNCFLAFVGENDAGSYGRELIKEISNFEGKDRILITGWIEQSEFQNYLAATDIAVQLRCNSRGETSAAVLDCLKYGLPTIVNANGSMAEIDQNSVVMLDDEFELAELTNALETLFTDRSERNRLREAARERIVSKNDPQTIAQHYFDAIEKFYEQDSTSVRTLASSIRDLPKPPSDQDLLRVAEALSFTFPARPHQKQVLFDVSTMMSAECERSLQVVFSQSLEILDAESPSAVRMEPVYGLENGGYNYARRLTTRLLGCPDTILPDEPIDVAAGDIMIITDPPAGYPESSAKHRRRMRNLGVKIVIFLSNDFHALLELSKEAVGLESDAWLSSVTESDGIACHSNLIADDLLRLVERYYPDRVERLSRRIFVLEDEADHWPNNSGLSKGVDDVLRVLGSSL